MLRIPSLMSASFKSSSSYREKFRKPRTISAVRLLPSEILPMMSSSSSMASAMPNWSSRSLSAFNWPYASFTSRPRYPSITSRISVMFHRKSWMLLVRKLIGLLISCPIPALRWPNEAIFCALTHWVCVRLQCSFDCYRSCVRCVAFFWSIAF